MDQFMELVSFQKRGIVALLDNFTLSQVKEAVDLNEKANNLLLLEISGNVTEDSLSSWAETGVDRISTGDLTKNVKALDLSMRFVLQ